MSSRQTISMKMSDTEMVNATLDALQEASEALRCLAALRQEPRFALVAERIMGIRMVALRAFNAGKMERLLDSNGRLTGNVRMN